jgi:hypothetical protein
MNDEELESGLRAMYRAEVSQTEPVPLSLQRGVAAIPRTATTRRRLFGRGRSLTLLAAAALLLVGGALATGSGVLLRSNLPPAPSLGPLAIASPDAPSPSPSKSATPTPVSSPTAAPIMWTQASLNEDWPAPVRTEPVGPPVVKKLFEDPQDPTNLEDPVGDEGSAVPWVDITNVSVGLGNGHASSVHPGLAGDVPLVPPTDRWSAYGIVVDTDADGVADLRFGVDNIPKTTPGKDEHRAWVTDLHTGHTDVAIGPPYGAVGDHFFDTFYPPSLHLGGDIAGGGSFGLKAPFYVWASEIQDGRVVATDYAPDVGWLDPTRRAKN